MQGGSPKSLVPGRCSTHDKCPSFWALQLSSSDRSKCWYCSKRRSNGKLAAEAPASIRASLCFQPASPKHKANAQVHCLRQTHNMWNPLSNAILHTYTFSTGHPTWQRALPYSALVPVCFGSFVPPADPLRFAWGQAWPRQQLMG